jgi:predicted TIM-barrel enzyme
LEDLELASAAAKGTPVFIGSGANWENVSTLLSAADGVIVSSSLKRHGRIDQPIDPNRVSQFVEAAISAKASLPLVTADSLTLRA